MSDEKKRITRIDLVNLPNHQGTLVEKYQDGWTASSRAASTATNKEMTFDEIIAWLKANEWLVYEWPAFPELGIERGARAFRGKPLPVRSRSSIIWYRDMYQERLQRYFQSKKPDPYTGMMPPQPINIGTIDLAYYL